MFCIVSYCTGELEDSKANRLITPSAALAEEAVEYRIETTFASEDFPDSDYQGWPDDQKDRLWNKYEGRSRCILPRRVPTS